MFMKNDVKQFLKDHSTCKATRVICKNYESSKFVASETGVCKREVLSILC